MPVPEPITAWAVTTGEAGMRSQARGLARAVAGTVIEKKAPAGWSWPVTIGTRDEFAPPWPDLLITCGRRSTALSVALRKASGGRMLTVHIQDPRMSPAAFDLVVAMAHDQIAAAPNVIKVTTALHDLAPEDLASAAEAWRGQFKPLGVPLAGVLIGGSSRRAPFGPDHGRRLIVLLKRLRFEGGAGLAMTPSRRTPLKLRAMLAAAFKGDPGVFLWDMAGENPYHAILALADRLVVTGDSVSMISEALSTGRPVEVFDLGATHYRRVFNALEEAGRVRRFTGDPVAAPPIGPINATNQAAAAVRQLLQDRTGVLG